MTRLICAALACLALAAGGATAARADSVTPAQTTPTTVPDPAPGAGSPKPDPGPVHLAPKRRPVSVPVQHALPVQHVSPPQPTYRAPVVPRSTAPIVHRAPPPVKHHPVKKAKQHPPVTPVAAHPHHHAAVAVTPARRSKPSPPPASLSRAKDNSLALAIVGGLALLLGAIAVIQTLRAFRVDAPEASSRSSTPTDPVLRLQDGDFRSCRVDLWRGYVRSQFVALERVGGAEQVVAESPFFAARSAQTRRALAAHEQLVARLVELGWECESVGPGWFQWTLQFAPTAATGLVPALQSGLPGE
jgi:hypothetical protein